MLQIRSAFTNNLKHIDVDIPIGKLTVITGVSGSGKSSLAFDTIYEEGRRRYLMFSGLETETNQTYGEITGLSPTVALEQRVIRQTNVRSTVGSKSQMIHGLAYLYAKYGEYNGFGQNHGMRQNTMSGLEFFNRNTTKGMCLRCIGRGYITQINTEKMLQPYSQRLSELFQGKIVRKKEYVRQLTLFCTKHQLDFETRIQEMSDTQRNELINGDAVTGFDGLEAIFRDYTGDTMFSKGRKHSDIYRMYTKRCVCQKCKGYGLGEKALNTYIQGKHIGELAELTITELKAFIQSLPVNEDGVIKGIVKKAELMEEVGLSHLSLGRIVPTLSGGEVQRLFLVSYLITNLQSLIFVFDEPTIGLHEIEKQRLIQVIRKLARNHNTVIVVEHDKSFMERADYIVDIGPGAGEYGGQLMFQGSYEKFLSCKDSLTSRYLNGSCQMLTSAKIRKPDLNYALKMKNVTIHNLQSVSVMIPLGVMVGIAGVSGSGKSSLISDALVPILKKKLQNRFVDLSEEEEEEPEEDTGLGSVDVQGIEKIEKCIIADQKPIGRKSTSTPISYLGGLERIRELLADTSYAKEHDYGKGLFSKNSEGRCLCCQGLGEIPVDIGLGNQLFLRCEDCDGTGYVSEALEVNYNGKNIYEIMQMSFAEAEAFFKQDKKLSALMTVMVRVGMGYMKLGQKTTTISGGEAQRIKLAKELSQSTRGCLFIFDEPTTGLSFRDTEHLMRLLNDIVDVENSMIIIEHDIDVLKNCDYLIELGPGGGTAGGRIIAAGTVNEVKKNPDSVIAEYL